MEAVSTLRRNKEKHALLLQSEKKSQINLEKTNMASKFLKGSTVIFDYVTDYIII